MRWKSWIGLSRQLVHVRDNGRSLTIGDDRGRFTQPRRDHLGIRNMSSYPVGTTARRYLFERFGQTGVAVAAWAAASGREDAPADLSR